MQQDEEQDVEYFVYYNLESWVHWVEILCTCDLYFNVDIASLLWKNVDSYNFYLASCIHRLFPKSGISLYIAASIPAKKRRL
jgi:hypothetical protein